MDDLVRQLEKAFEWSNDPMLSEAADEITALRARLDAVTEERNVQNDLRQIAEDAADDFRARAERAEAALATARRDAPTLEEAAAITRELRQLGWMVPLSIVRAATDAAHARALADEAPE